MGCGNHWCTDRRRGRTLEGGGDLRELFADMVLKEVMEDISNYTWS